MASPKKYVEHLTVFSKSYDTQSFKKHTPGSGEKGWKNNHTGLFFWVVDELHLTL